MHSPTKHFMQSLSNWDVGFFPVWCIFLPDLNGQKVPATIFEIKYSGYSEDGGDVDEEAFLFP